MTKLPDWTCSKCGRQIPFSEPYIGGGYTGHKTPIHDPCGPGYVAYRLQPGSKDKIAVWEEIGEAWREKGWIE